MKIRITESVICNGGHQEAGSIIEASDRDAKMLINMGRAVAVVATKPPAEEPDDAEDIDEPKEPDKGKRKKG